MAKIYHNVPELIKQSKNYDENLELNQINLFESQTNQDFKISFTEQPEWDEPEKIKKEFESIGFFVSDHPLKNYKQVLQGYNVINYQEFIESSNITECMLS